MDSLPFGLFPDAPVIDNLPPSSDSVYAASVIRASRDLTKQHNDAKNDNVEKANAHIEDSVKAYNSYLESRKADCTPEPEPEKKKRRFGIF